MLINSPLHFKFKKKYKIEVGTPIFHIAGLKFFLHRIFQVLNYHLSQDPEFFRHLKNQLRGNHPLFGFFSENILDIAVGERSFRKSEIIQNYGLKSGLKLG